MQVGAAPPARRRKRRRTPLPPIHLPVVAWVDGSEP